MNDRDREKAASSQCNVNLVIKVTTSCFLGSPYFQHQVIIRTEKSIDLVKMNYYAQQGLLLLIEDMATKIHGEKNPPSYKTECIIFSKYAIEVGQQANSTPPFQMTWK